jgi:hypothetical protein
LEILLTTGHLKRKEMRIPDEHCRGWVGCV